MLNWEGDVNYAIRAPIICLYEIDLANVPNVLLLFFLMKNTYPKEHLSDCPWW